MFAGMAAALLVASRMPTLQVVNQRFSEPRALLLGGGVVFVFGALDDRFNLDAVTKLAGQILAASVMVLQGVQLLWLPIPGQGTLILGQDWSVVLTVSFIVIVINAVNFIDGLDGLAAGVVGIAALAFFALSYNLSVQSHLPYALPPMLIAIIVAGLCLGFLPHNFHPARVFMGDSGSMLIGLLLAASTVSLTGQVDVVTQYQQYGAFLPLLLPFAILLVPFADLVLAVARRTKQGRAPWSPDKQHLHHRLAGARPLAAPGGVDHVLLVGTVRRRRGRALGDQGAAGRGRVGRGTGRDRAGAGEHAAVAGCAARTSRTGVTRARSQTRQTVR